MKTKFGGDSRSETLKLLAGGIFRIFFFLIEWHRIDKEPVVDWVGCNK